MAKQSLAGNAARAALLRGVEKVVGPVQVTLGPRGRNVLISRRDQPLATRDGVTVAKEMANLPDPFEQMGALYARECADAAVTTAGDGTTTTCVILQAIFREGIKLVDAGAEPLLLADGIALAAAACAETIKKLAIPATPELVRQAAIISTHGDVELGTLIAEATCRVGANGVLELQESRDEKTTIEHVEGFYFERGFGQSYSGQKCVLQNPLILISERQIVASGLAPNGQPLQGDGIYAVAMIAVQERRPLLIIAEDLIGDAMSFLAANQQKGVINCAFVKLPGFGEHRKAALEDLRIAVGAKHIHSQMSTRKEDQLSSFKIEDLGWCEQANIGAGRTVLLGGGANEMEKNKRIKQLIDQSTEATNPFEKEQLDHRIARLTGGVAVLRVGANSEPAMIEKKARAEDAIHACRGALAEGVVPGGGVALLRAADEFWKRSDFKEDVAHATHGNCGESVLLNAIYEPARQILRNSGKSEETVETIMSGLRGKLTSASFGYNSATGKLGDLYKMGIVDPAKVVLTALTKAASIGALLLTTEVLVTDIPEPKPATPIFPPQAY